MTSTDVDSSSGRFADLPRAHLPEEHLPGAPPGVTKARLGQWLHHDCAFSGRRYLPGVEMGEGLGEAGRLQEASESSCTSHVRDAVRQNWDPEHRGSEDGLVSHPGRAVTSGNWAVIHCTRV